MNFFNRRKRPRPSVPISETSPWQLYGSQRAVRGVAPLRAHSQTVNSKLYIYLGDITSLQVDSIVNAANNSLLGGGGVDGAIHAAAGPGLRTECSKLGGCTTGDAKITKGHNLPSKHIIHTVGPRGKNPEVLKSSYNKCFQLMKESSLNSIAFPCISTGVYGYPNKAAAQVAIETTREFIETNLDHVDAVIFCLFTKQDIEAYHELLPAYFPLGLQAKVESKGDEKKEEEVSAREVEEGEEVSAGEVEEEENVSARDSKVESKGDEKKEEEVSAWEVEEGEGDKEEEPAKCSEGKATTAEVNEAIEEIDNAAKCEGVSESTSKEQSEPMSQEQSEPMSQEQSEPMSQEQSEPMSQKQSEPMSQEQSEPMSQEQSEPMSQEQFTASSQQDEKEEPISQQETLLK